MKVIKDYPEVHKYLAEGSYLCDGQEIPYQVISEETILGSESGEAEAAVFSFSYFRKDVENAQERPVIFVFNGGPGSSSVWLHLGLMAPRRLYLKDDVHPETVPPFQMVDNQECLLDTCDLVMIDPVETGYSRLLKEDAADKYFGLNQDAHSVAVMIRDWLVRYDRFNSPKYLLCESYGTIRSALLMNELTGGCFSQDGRLAAISLNGVFMLGTALIIPGYEKMPELYHEVYQMLAWAAVN